MGTFKGCIVEESLVDNRLLNKITIAGIRITEEEKPSERWHIYNVTVSEKEIKSISKNIKPKWYMHFWKGRDIVVVFKDKIFKFNFDKKEEWGPAVEYGLSQGIPKEQLDFALEF